ncbi:MAG: AAA family ATPase [Thermodesulfobacteriaceae bacterium]|nr:AAA family ATPase [Thermodesulfobacteriaceae bacterium]MDW8135178.1 AAA family ATPase [Thermodesulfobacterium sp.]
MEKIELTLNYAIEEINRVRKILRDYVKGQPHIIDLVLLNLIKGGVMYLIGPAGISKTRLIRLAASAFYGKDKVFYKNMDVGTSKEDIIGHFDPEKLLKENKLQRKTERFLNTLVHIYDEFAYLDVKIKAILTTYMLERIITPEDQVLKGKTRAIFLTGNVYEELEDIYAKQNGMIAVVDRCELVPYMDRPPYFSIINVLTDDEEKMRQFDFETPIASPEILDQIKEIAKKVKIPAIISYAGIPLWEYLYEELPDAAVISLRKYANILSYAQILAVLENRIFVTHEDVGFLVENAIYTDREDIKQKAKRIINLVVSMKDVILNKIQILETVINSFNLDLPPNYLYLSYKKSLTEVLDDLLERAKRQNRLNENLEAFNFVMDFFNTTLGLILARLFKDNEKHVDIESIKIEEIQNWIEKKERELLKVFLEMEEELNYYYELYRDIEKIKELCKEIPSEIIDEARVLYAIRYFLSLFEPKIHWDSLPDLVADTLKPKEDFKDWTNKFKERMNDFC